MSTCPIQVSDDGAADSAADGAGRGECLPRVINSCNGRENRNGCAGRGHHSGYASPYCPSA